MLNDIRVGLRLLWKDKVFTTTGVLTLALCIGANAALFSVVHNVLLRPLPVPESDRIVLMGNAYPGAGPAAAGGENSAVPDFYDRLKDMDVFEEQAFYNSTNQSIDQNGAPTRIRVTRVTPSFFRLLRVAPAAGRIFTEDDGEVGNDRKAILSYALWQSQFAGDPSAIGRELRVDGVALTIVGVMPKGFYYLNPNVLLWRPLAFTPQQRSDEQRHSNNFQNIARLKAGATVARAQQEVDAINARNMDRFPALKPLLINAGFHTTVNPLQDVVVRQVRSTLYLMWGGALFVLLIGCVNVANLVLVRSRSRLKELATRLALGAGRAIVARQLVFESLILTMVSAVGGLLIGYAALQLLGSLNIQDLPRGQEIRLDGIVIAATIGASLAIGIVLGLLPVVSVLPVNLTSVLREEGRSGTSGRGARTLRRALVVAQVAFAFVLLIGAGLLFASFRRVLAVQPGFNPDGVLTVSVQLPRARYTNDQDFVRFTHDALERLRGLPGAKTVGATDTIPFGGNNSDSVIFAEGYQMKPGESVISPAQVDVTSGYFEAIGARLYAGRFFDEREGPLEKADDPKAFRAIIVDRTLAKRFWPNQDAVGRRMYRPSDVTKGDLTAVTEKTHFFTVVGIIEDIKLHDLTEGRTSVGAYYLVMDQDISSSMTFAIRTSVDPLSLTTTVRGALNAVDPQLPVFETQTLDERVEKSLMARRSPMRLSLVFGVVALFLAAIGIYGVLSYLVTQRTKEIGIRIALGSSAGDVFQLVLREGLLLVAGGFVIGGAGALALRKSLESQLFGISATDPIVIGTVTATLAAVALVACALPARRATRIDPIIALTE
jgi:predicted permease